MEGKSSAFKQPRYRRQVHGGDETRMPRNGLGLGRSGIKLADIEAGALGFIGDQGQGRGFQGHEPDHFQISQIFRCIGQHPYQMLRFTAGRTNEHPLAGPDLVDGISCLACFFNVIVCPIGRIAHGTPFMTNIHLNKIYPFRGHRSTIDVCALNEISCELGRKPVYWKRLISG